MLYHIHVYVTTSCVTWNYLIMMIRWHTYQIQSNASHITHDDTRRHMMTHDDIWRHMTTHDDTCQHMTAHDGTHDPRVDISVAHSLRRARYIHYTIIKRRELTLVAGCCWSRPAPARPTAGSSCTGWRLTWLTNNTKAQSQWYRHISCFSILWSVSGFAFCADLPCAERLCFVVLNFTSCSSLLFRRLTFTSVFDDDGNGD